MATIALYKNQVNQMPSLISGMKKSVMNLGKELQSLGKKVQSVNQSVCDLSEVMSSIQSSSQIQEKKEEALENWKKESEQFVVETVLIDTAVASTINKLKKEFYKEHSYLKPDCEKSGWEKAKDKLKSAEKWCAEHWESMLKLAIVIELIAVLALVTLLTGGVAAVIAGGALAGAISEGLIGGIMGGVISAVLGGSFFDGFADGALSGAVSGAITGAAVAGGSIFGTFFGGDCGHINKAGKILKVLEHTSKITGILSSGMAAFDFISMIAGFVDSDNLLVTINQNLHSNVLYNMFQIGVNAAAIFSVTAYSSMSDRMKQPPVCFIAGTMILTAAGVIAIERIKAGDRVISTNPDTFETVEKTVLETYIRETDKLVYLTVNGEEIITTETHPFYVNGKGFVDAGLLETGDELVGADGRTLFVNSVVIQLEEEPITVYNFQVEEFHTYHVGNAGILVHNACRGEKPKAPTADSGSGINGSYEQASYHGKKNNPVKNKAPNKGQQALDNSVSIGSNTTRRVGISDGEIVVLDESTSGIFHGHVRSWNELTEPMKAALRKAGKVNKKGKIIN